MLLKDTQFIKGYILLLLGPWADLTASLAYAPLVLWPRDAGPSDGCFGYAFDTLMVSWRGSLRRDLLMSALQAFGVGWYLAGRSGNDSKRARESSDGTYSRGSPVLILLLNLNYLSTAAARLSLRTRPLTSQ